MVSTAFGLTIGGESVLTGQIKVTPKM
jgi:addiction module HigA family antidote